MNVDVNNVINTPHGLDRWYLLLGRHGLEPFRPEVTTWLGAHRAEMSRDSIDVFIASHLTLSNYPQVRGFMHSHLDMLTTPLHSGMLVMVGPSAHSDAGLPTNRFPAGCIAVVDRPHRIEREGWHVRILDDADREDYSPRTWAYRRNLLVMPERDFPTLPDGMPQSLTSILSDTGTRTLGDFQAAVVPLWDSYIPGCPCGQCLLVLSGVDAFAAHLVTLNVWGNDEWFISGTGKEYLGRVIRWMRGQVIAKHTRLGIHSAEGTLHQPLWIAPPPRDLLAEFSGRTFESPDEEAAALKEALSAQQEEISRLNGVYERDFTAIAQKLHREAIDRSWCGEYERVMTAVNAELVGPHRLPPIVRPSNYQFDARALVTVEMRYTGTSGPYEGAPPEEELIAWLGRRHGVDMATHTTDVIAGWRIHRESLTLVHPENPITFHDLRRVAR